MLYDVPTPLLILLMFAAMATAVEVGLRLGKRFGRTSWTNAKETLTSLTAATLGLLGLMLAFGFNQAAGRYETRVNLVVAEAQAILLAHLYLDHLTPENAAAGQALLHRYTAERIAYITVGYDQPRQAEVVARTRALGGELWDLVRMSGNYREPVPTLRSSNMTQLTNAVSGLAIAARAREEARARIVPPALMGALLLMSTLAAGMLAYTAGATHHPDRRKVYAFLALILLVLYMIVDLDRPLRGLMKVSPEPLQTVAKIIAAPE
jgi:hypothetical protein